MSTQIAQKLTKAFINQNVNKYTLYKTLKKWLTLITYDKKKYYCERANLIKQRYARQGYRKYFVRFRDTSTLFIEYRYL